MGSHRLFNENNISGYDYLHNLVHLPFYLQNSGLRKSKLAQQTANALMKKFDFDDTHLVRSVSITTTVKLPVWPSLVIITQI